MTYYLGIDIGTSGCRSCVIDTRAQVHAQARVALPPPVHHDDRREQDPVLWWKALGTNLERLGTQIPLERVEAVCIDGTSASLLLCDAGGLPLGPALMYNDARATVQAEQIARHAPPETAAHGATSSLAKLLYLLETPAAQGASHALHQADWLLGRLCGRYGISDENNALKLGYDPLARRWPAWLDRLDVPSALLPEVLPPGQPLGVLDPRWCVRWGFREATRVLSGTTDSTAGFIATGAGDGEAVSSLGSTLVLKVRAEHPVFAPQYGVYSHRLGEHWLVGGASNSGGAVLRKHFTQAEIDRLTEHLQPGKPTGLDYYPLSVAGERFPLNQPGLPPRLQPRPVDDAVFFQGMLEGIAAIELRGYRLLEELGAPYPARIYSVGGGAGNAAWRSIRQAMLGVPVLLATHQEAAYGAALLARHGVQPF